MNQDQYLPSNHPYIQPSPDAGPSNPKLETELWDCFDTGIDELLLGLGYKVKSTEMAHVAHKIEHLEQVWSNNQQIGASIAQESNNQLATSSGLENDVHYNPSDINSWLESMITDLDVNPVFDDSDLQLIPGKAVFPQIQHPKPEQQVSVPNKRLKTSSDAPRLGNTENTWGVLQAELPPRPMVAVVDAQTNGVQLVHSLMASAEAVNLGHYKLAKALLKNIVLLAASQPGAMKKVATYFAEALSRRIDGNGVRPVRDNLEMHFYETCPYLKFAHFTANQAILEAFTNKKHVHIIDFSMKEGMQWPALMQALALRPGGPPSLRLTGIGPPSEDNTDHLQEVGWKLAQLAETIHVEFEFRGFVANSLADLDAGMLNLRDDEVVAVNSVFEMHQLLARPNALEKVMNVVEEMKPVIFTVVEQEADHNGPVFLKRFNEALYYYSSLFDSLEDSGPPGLITSPISNNDKMKCDEYLGEQICNVVACEGIERIERHETREQWRNRFEIAGLQSVHLGSNAFKQASMLLALFAGGFGYKVEEQDGCLMLAWQNRQLITTSAWKLG